MKCPKCQTENRESRKFCASCGEKLLLICPECGVENFPGENFCGECGHNLTLPSEPIPKDLSFDEKIAKIQRYLPEGLTEKILSQRARIEGERKQVTVMFCDMEGFTALTERLGPEEAYAVMDEVYEVLIHKVHDYEGTVNEMTGDGIVALFGAPIALEDAPQRAIRSGMAIHKEMVRFSEKMRKDKPGARPIKMRVGIHTGPVVVGTLGNDLRVEFKAVGDTVNLAARMEELAEPGTTYATEETFKLTEGLFRFERLGAKTVKGRSEPANVYQVIAPSTRRTRFDVSAERGLSAFVGRERELELLLDGFVRTKMGRGQAFSIVGEAGVGKSRLLYEFRKAVANEDLTFLEGKSLSYSRGIAYHPIIDILKSNFDIKEVDSPFQIVEKVREGLRILEEDEEILLPSLLELLSVEQDGVETIAITPEGKKDRTIQALRRIVLKGSEIRPLVIAFEDLHWADKSSEDVLKSLLESIPGAMVLLLFTYRPEFIFTWGAKSYHSQLNLNRLSNRESLVMVTHLLGTEDIDRDLEELILEKTEGVPFFIEEFVKSLKDLKIIEQKATTYTLRKEIREVVVPSTVQDVIMARIDSLPQGAKEVLQTGSVIDREFSFELIKKVAGVAEQDLVSHLSALRESELLYERGVHPNSTYIFKHALTQEVAYNGLLSRTRKEAHEKIGEAIEDLYPDNLEESFELLAYHYVRSKNMAKAVQYLDLANQKACRASAMEEARSYFDEAMRILDKLPEDDRNRERRIFLLGNQTNVFNLLFQIPEYYDLLNRYQSLAIGLDNPGLEGAFLTCLGWCEWSLALFDESIKNATRATQLCEKAGNWKDAGFAYNLLQASFLYKGDFDKAIDFKEDVLRNMSEQFNLRVCARAHYNASAAYAYLGQWDKVEKEERKALSVAQHYGDNSVISVTAFYLSFVYSHKGDAERAMKYAELADEKALTPAEKVWAQAARAVAWHRSGQTERSTEALEPIIEAVRGGRHLATLLFIAPWLAEGYLHAGEYDKARQTANEIRDLSEKCGARPVLGWTHRVLGEVDLKTNSDKAASHFEKAIEIAQEVRAENELALAYSAMGRFHKQQGNPKQATKYLTDALKIFERLGTPFEPDKVRKELADLAAVG